MRGPGRDRLAIAIVASGAVQHNIKTHGLRAIALTDRWAKRDVVIYQRANDCPSLALLNLLEHLQLQAKFRHESDVVT